MAVQLIRIESLEDKRLDAYTKLTERELRCVLEPEKGIFIAESAKVIERAVDAGLEPVSFLLGERWVPQLQPFFERLEQERPELDIPAFVGSMDLMRDLTGFTVTRGALAAFRRPPLADASTFLTACRGTLRARLRARGNCGSHECRRYLQECGSP